VDDGGSGNLCTNEAGVIGGPKIEIASFEILAETYVKGDVGVVHVDGMLDVFSEAVIDDVNVIALDNGIQGPGEGIDDEVFKKSREARQKGSKSTGEEVDAGHVETLLVGQGIKFLEEFGGVLSSEKFVVGKNAWGFFGQLTLLKGAKIGQYGRSDHCTSGLFLCLWDV
jgi:hypothetical protein